MRKISSFSALASMCLVSTLAVGQCAESWYFASINCNTPICQNSITQLLPSGGGEFGVLYTCTTIYCCGQGYPTCYSLGINCNESGSLANTEMRQHLLQLAKTEDIVVSTCKGEYLPLELALANQPISMPRRGTVLHHEHSVKDLIGEGGS